MLNRRRRRRKLSMTQPELSQITDAEKAAWWERERLTIPLAELSLPVRIVNVLEANNVLQVRDLMRQTYDSLRAMRNFGETTFAEMRQALREIGIDSRKLWSRSRG